jgi:acyl-CoA thioesterase YciA
VLNRVPLIRVTAMPADTNPYGGVFGGWLMSQMALAAGSLASRHSQGKAVVVAADGLTFPGAPQPTWSSKAAPRCASRSKRWHANATATRK